MKSLFSYFRFAVNDVAKDIRDGDIGFAIMSFVMWFFFVPLCALMLTALIFAGTWSLTFEAGWIGKVIVAVLAAIAIVLYMLWKFISSYAEETNVKDSYDYY